ncbi:NUDIX hydrolase [Pontibacillus marinus]|uniref:DNA repair protein MutT n=1 Tax=Pontibacillus marinus BH030004 = DSM 16465 TaxID=1385511 RepID=A0A0A5GFK7_9BACI|nr:NUDIX hydrolase [Pontibacillus marinus]KGX90804.1 DNA repair protein MutT [Pontibacillus marinus BH030004 = DSM 16465]
MDKWKTLKSEYLYQTPFGNLRKEKCELPNSNIIDYYVNEYEDWVNAVVLTKEKQMVLVKQYRHAGEDFFLEIPAGKMEKGESHEEGILREVKEETGYVSQKPPILLGDFMVNPATQTNKVRTYLIQDAYKEFEQDLDENEEIRVELIDFGEMGNILQNNQIKTQLFTANGYYMARAYLGTC